MSATPVALLASWKVKGSRREQERGHKRRQPMWIMRGKAGSDWCMRTLLRAS